MPSTFGQGGQGQGGTALILLPGSGAQQPQTADGSDADFDLVVAQGGQGQGGDGSQNSAQ